MAEPALTVDAWADLRAEREECHMVVFRCRVVYLSAKDLEAA